MWRIELLGSLRIRRSDDSEDQAITRFRTHKTGVLLAFLAFYPGRSHAREALAGMHWPDDDIEIGRRKLRQALAALRAQLEPDGEPVGRVLLTDRLTVRLNPGVVTTDVADFEAALAAAALAPDTDKIPLLTTAVELYAGDLLPGYYETWITAHTLYLQDRYFRAADQLAEILTDSGDLARAIEVAGRALTVDPLREETHRRLMSLYASAGRPADVVRQFHTLERALKEEWHESPSSETIALMASLTERLQPPERLRPVPDLPQPPTAPRSLPNRSPRLPLQLTRLFGRDDELADLYSRLSTLEDATSRVSTRLITLTGPGGSGKTRLAIEAAERSIDAFTGAVWFAPLADIADPRRIPDAIADALALPHSSALEPFEQTVEALSHRPALLVLDNVEHLIPEASAMIRRLLERIPLLSLLVTSRQRLGLSGEQEFAVGPLPVPVHGTSALPAALLSCPSVALFVDRAQLARPDFRMTHANARAVAELCDRLEGIPLAIELAATQAQVLSPIQMLGQLARRFDFLVSNRHDTERRHRTLHEAIDWSYRLLPPAMQPFFARLSVFRGGWTAEAADCVCRKDEVERMKRSKALDVDSSFILHPSANEVSLILWRL